MKTKNKLFEELLLQRSMLIQTVKTANNRDLNVQPQNAWSVNQVIDHLIQAERSTLRYISKKLLEPDRVHQSGWKQTWRSMLLNISLYSPIKFKAPATLPPPPPKLNVDMLMKEWDSVTEELKSVFSQIPANKINYTWFRHPVAGKLNVKQTLRFMAIHVHRHHGQIHRILKQTI